MTASETATLLELRHAQHGAREAEAEAERRLQRVREEAESALREVEGRRAQLERELHEAREEMAAEIPGVPEAAGAAEAALSGEGSHSSASAPPAEEEFGEFGGFSGEGESEVEAVSDQMAPQMSVHVSAASQLSALAVGQAKLADSHAQLRREEQVTSPFP